MAFTDFGVDSLVDLIKIHREMPRASSADLSREHRPCGPPRRVTLSPPGLQHHLVAAAARLLSPANLLLFQAIQAQAARRVHDRDREQAQQEMRRDVFTPQFGALSC